MRADSVGILNCSYLNLLYLIVLITTPLSFAAVITSSLETCSNFGLLFLSSEINIIALGKLLSNLSNRSMPSYRAPVILETYLLVKSLSGSKNLFK